MYKNGGGTVEYLEVLLGAQSFGDFIERVHTLSTIAEQDRDILEEHQADHELLEEKKAQVEDNLSTLENHLEQLEELRAELEDMMAVKNDVMSGLEDDEMQLLDEIDALANEQQLLEDQEDAKRDQIAKAEAAAEAERQAQEDARVAAAAEAETAAETAAATTSSPSTSNSSGGGGSSSDSGSSVGGGSSSVSDTGGTLARPATGNINSHYGMRNGRMHHGVDIPQAGRSNVPIVASESGTVQAARYMDGYGNTVIIRHNIGGRTVETLYAHLESIHVSVGQSVSRTQQIGIMGNTGRSTGPHLHFEVHEGTWNGAKSNSVNPVNYL
ncbi:murein hydrolase activator EnvC [Geomicrobium sp. JCM 19039]|uniref:murein hydrolase activator EnvC family protein n=1 Tax=Geomicrobium sp. JCM 19039 TaxID=1460636 RepID=UPI000693E3B4|nr:M23 family metallopeptidase [Geomicrobium sp. JCM 19039]